MTTGNMLLPRNHHHLLQISTCLSGELEILKSPSSSWSSSTLSTTSSSAAAASPCSVAATRKPRTPRKRPNQTYNEAAALLSASFPNLFRSPKTLAGVGVLLLRRREEDDDHHLLFSPPPPPFPPRLHCSSSALPPPAAEQADSDFDAESLLDEDAGDGGGIDTILGDLVDSGEGPPPIPMGLGLGLGLGLGVAALRRDSSGGEAANWWCFPAVDMRELSPRLAAKQKKKVKKKAKPKPESPESGGGGLSLKLNYDGVLRAWSGKGSPFSEEMGLGGRNDDVAARAAEIELFPAAGGGGGGVREATLLRYKEKRLTRLFSKKIIRYQVRKVNADRRPRMKGRFVRRPNSKHE